MEISFPINKLLDKNLTADDYTIALLIKEKRYGLLNKYMAIAKASFQESLKRLKECGYLSYPTIGNIIPIKEAVITDKFLDLLSQGDKFDELYNLYPVKTIRTDGKTDYLRINKNKCKVKYKKIIKNNLMLHDHIVDCLKLDVEKRVKTNNMAYMKRMENWLDNEEWQRVYEYREKQIEDKKLSDIKKANTYGTDLL